MRAVPVLRGHKFNCRSVRARVISSTSADRTPEQDYSLPILYSSLSTAQMTDQMQDNKGRMVVRKSLQGIIES